MVQAEVPPVGEVLGEGPRARLEVWAAAERAALAVTGCDERGAVIYGGPALRQALRRTLVDLVQTAVRALADEQLEHHVTESEAHTTCGRALASPVPAGAEGGIENTAHGPLRWTTRLDARWISCTECLYELANAPQFAPRALVAHELVDAEARPGEAPLAFESEAVVELRQRAERAQREAAELRRAVEELRGAARAVVTAHSSIAGRLRGTTLDRAILALDEAQRRLRLPDEGLARALDTTSGADEVLG